MYGKTASEHTWVDAYLDEVEDWRAKYLQLIYNDQVTHPPRTCCASVLAASLMKHIAMTHSVLLHLPSHLHVFHMIVKMPI